ncbi:hypothetical protein B0G71_1117 [Paraburkholderia sp. BL27I4N3]|uniref:hypothetical protein n=1 Tax=Paraburkholderia sp. BL27I4N3 TaxID=1938805 RepID=UPI000E25CFD1|nr:hypothetical protein [Paraburkholderia sp. BL27I4N3]REE18131.1 hypothetical protein B0G71_1117 [Paraburkholderia sp. BL27I4N3]
MASKTLSEIAHLDDEEFRLNKDLANQINEMLEGQHFGSDCAKSGRPMLLEAVLWCVGGAIVWIVALRLVN